MSAPRILFMALPPPAVRTAITAALQAHGALAQLGRRLFTPDNWHQSLSGRIFAPTPAQVECLLAVGAGLQAPACTLQHNRIDSAPDQHGRIHLTLRGASAASLAPLLSALQQSLQQAGQGAIATGVTPHTTLSYDAPAVLPTIRLASPIRWTIDELLLVSGGGSPYRYDVLGRWPLLPERDPPPVQIGLF